MNVTGAICDKIKGQHTEEKPPICCPIQTDIKSPCGTDLPQTETLQCLHELKQVMESLRTVRRLHSVCTNSNRSWSPCAQSGDSTVSARTQTGHGVPAHSPETLQCLHELKQVMESLRTVYSAFMNSTRSCSSAPLSCEVIPCLSFSVIVLSIVLIRSVALPSWKYGCEA